jgi:hypothetical protein
MGVFVQVEKANIYPLSFIGYKENGKKKFGISDSFVGEMTTREPASIKAASFLSLIYN